MDIRGCIINIDLSILSLSKDLFKYSLRCFDGLNMAASELELSL
jgi:hypothetical protein